MPDKLNGPFDLIVQAGQSNSEGCGLGPVKDPYVPTDNILYLTRDLTVAPGADRIWGDVAYTDFSLYFAREYVRAGLLLPERRVLVVRTAVGGTGFLDKRWGKNDDLFADMVRMIRYAKEMHPANRFIAFLWHQGETDAIMGATLHGHAQNLAGLVDAVRQETDESDLPFVAGDFVQDWKRQNTAICQPVIEAIRQVCEEKNGQFVETDGLLSNDQQIGNGDTIHFSGEALHLLGKRYYEKIFG